MSDPDRPQMIKIPEAAEILGVSRTTLWRRATETGEIAPGVPVTEFGPRTKMVSRLQVERLANGERVAS